MSAHPKALPARLSRAEVFFGSIYCPLQLTNSTGRTGAEDGQERWGAGEMQQVKTAPMNMTLKALRGGDGPFPTELKLLRCPPSRGWGSRMALPLAPALLEAAQEPAAKPSPTRSPQPHSLSHRSSSPVLAMDSCSALPRHEQEEDPPAVAPCVLLLAPRGLPTRVFVAWKRNTVGVGW